MRVNDFGHLEFVLHHIRACLALRSLIERFFVDGQMKGKLSSVTVKQDVRVILLLPAFLNLCDCMLSRKLEAFISQLLPSVPHYLADVSKGTQPSEIVFPISLAIEKGLNHHDDVDIAMAVVKSLHVLLLPHKQVSPVAGAPGSLASALLRPYFVPTARVTFDIE